MSTQSYYKDRLGFDPREALYDAPPVKSSSRGRSVENNNHYDQHSPSKKQKQTNGSNNNSLNNSQGGYEDALTQFKGTMSLWDFFVENWDITDERDAIQKKTFTKWVNKHLKKMNQTCKVCGEPAGGFHFGAFTCEGCKSFFGRSYNNLSSISECKNNGECIINKKNRTACKACRLRKCLLVGMSKSGSRYGRRSNWFKIHCLLQEQQQQAAAAAAQGNRKTPPPSALSMFGHPSYPPGMGCRPPCTKEELMLLGFEDYKHPSASPSVSSPDSHNSDSSVEVGDRRNNLIRQSITRDSMASFNKELFLPLSFPGLSSMQMMPPPGFLPPTHLMFPGYHPSLYAQHQGLLKPAIELPLISSPSIANNNNRFVPNHNSKSSEEAKRYFLDAVLKSQRSPMNVNIKTEEEEDDTEDLVVSMTPPRSPITTSRSSRSPPSRPPVHSQDNPIDLSMKTNSSTSDDMRTMSGGESDLSDDEHEKRTSCHSELDDEDYGREVKRIKIHGTPLDLTTKA